MKLAKWRDFPPSIAIHLQQRVRERKISSEDLAKLDFWVRTDPDVPAGDWFKDFGSFKLYGEGALVKTILTADMPAYGEEI